jgi:hypothetical protein
MHLVGPIKTTAPATLPKFVPLMLRSRPSIPGALLGVTSVPTGASYEKAPIILPTRVAMFALTSPMAGLLLGGRLHIADVCDVQVDVRQTE